MAIMTQQANTVCGHTTPYLDSSRWMHNLINADYLKLRKPLYAICFPPRINHQADNLLEDLTLEKRMYNRFTLGGIQLGIHCSLDQSCSHHRAWTNHKRRGLSCLSRGKPSKKTYLIEPHFLCKSPLHLRFGLLGDRFSRELQYNP